MEHNEQVIFRVYQEKENAWERELRRIKAMGDNRLKTAAQKSLKLEQMLMMQTYKVNIGSVVLFERCYIRYVCRLFFCISCRTRKKYYKTKTIALRPK